MAWWKCLALGMTLWAGPLWAGQCPVMLTGDQVTPPGFNPRREQLFAYRSVPGSNGSSPKWETIPLHLDPVDHDGKLDFAAATASWDRPLMAKDRLILLPEDFGGNPAGVKPATWPCGAESGYELTLANNFQKKAFLFPCKSQMNSFSGANSPVHFSAGDRSVSTDSYLYNYRANNQLLFERIAQSQAGQVLTDISSDADQLIHADVKNFFTMRFRAKDIEAQILNYRSSPLGMASRLSFFLKILFFKINLALLPEAYYFRDSVYIPMVMHLPVDAAQYLNYKSGVFFTWKTAPNVKWDMAKSRIPIMRDFLATKSLADLQSTADVFCQGDLCRFSAMAQLPTGAQVELIFSLRKQLVQKGFIPFFIEDSDQLEDQWGRVSEYKGSRQGFYFETSGLGKGSHLWDFFIRFHASGSQSQSTDCPTNVTIRRLD